MKQRIQGVNDPATAEDRSGKALGRWALRVLVSALVLGITLWLLPTGQVWDAIAALPRTLWLAVLLGFLVGHVVAAAKWWLLIGGTAEIAFPSALKAHFAGLVANLCLPGVAGGDLVRAGLVIRGSDNKTRLAVASLADRLLDSFGLLLLAAGGALLALETVEGLGGPLWRIGGLFLLAAGAIAAATWVLPRLPKGGLLGRLADKVASVLTEFRAQPGKLLFCLALSLAVQSGFILLTVLLAEASGLSLPLAAWFFAWPLAKLIAVLPISVAGLGVREAGLASLLLPFGAAAATVVAVSLIWQSVLIAGGLLGGLVLLVTGKIARGTQPTQLAGGNR